MKPGPLRPLAFAIACIGGSWCISAQAAPADEKAVAQVLFDQARELVEHGDFAAACPKLAESQRIDPGIGTLLWLADCYENSGETASAWAAFKAAAGMAALRHDEREQVARDRAANLESKLVRLDITVPRETNVDGLQVRRDGVLVGSAEWGVALPVDPGNHAVKVIAPGFRPWTTTVQMSAGTPVERVTVPKLERMDGSTGSWRDDSAAVRSGERRGAGQRIAGLSVGASGVVAVLVGTFLALRSKALYDESNDGTAPHCLPDNECDAAGKKFRSDASSMAMAATVAMGAGAAAVAGGAVLYFTAPAALPRTTLAIAPTPSGAAMRVAWRF